MIPLTVSYFTKATEGRRGFPVLALWYAGSVLAIFLMLGGFVTIFFGTAAAYNISTNPWLNLVFFFILVLFGLSFLGLFEITLPASWGTAASRLSNPRSLLGVFFMALTLVLVSFSCIGPLLGTLLIDMVGGRYWAPLVGMTGFGLAFALPFGLLAGMPKLLQKLPRSGEWMDAFKVTLGFLELALALKFLSNADLVWHLGLLDREVYLTAWIVLFLTLGLYLLGLIPLKGGKLQEISIPRLLLGMSSTGLAIYLFTGLWGAPLKAFSGLLPPVHDEIGVRLLYGNPSASSTAETCDLPLDRKYVQLLRKHTPPGFCVFYDLEGAIAYAKSVNKPLLIDFTGHTCVNCRQVESSVWQEPAIRTLLQSQFVMVSLFVDDETLLDSILITSEGEKIRTLGDQWLHLQKDRYRIQAQPFYVITDESLEPLVPSIGFTLDKERYRRFLEAGIDTYKKKHTQI
jgi:thiol:disulfide interchange protein DsbD